MFDGTINYEKPLKNSGTVKANFKFVFSDNLREVKAEIEYTKGDGKTETKKQNNYAKIDFEKMYFLNSTAGSISYDDMLKQENERLKGEILQLKSDESIHLEKI